MTHGSSRRVFLATTAFAAGAAWLGPLGAAEGPAPESGGTSPGTPPDTPIAANWPAQPPELVREIVGVSHGNLARVKELVGKHRNLAGASWDWGFGDWETALGAASHVGNREIAEFLIANGARPTLFSATMLGQLEVVRAFVQSSPSVQKITGPHGITLLSHARAGGDAAVPVLRYLEDLGDADPRPAVVPLSEAEAALLVGTYAFGPSADDQVEVAVNRLGLGFARKGGAPRNLTHLGGLEFYPAGAPLARIRFQRAGERIASVTVHDPDLVLTAMRV